MKVLVAGPTHRSMMLAAIVSKYRFLLPNPTVSQIRVMMTLELVILANLSAMAMTLGPLVGRARIQCPMTLHWAPRGVSLQLISVIILDLI